MRRENLLYEGNEKVISKRSRHHSRHKVSRQRNSDAWWRRTNETSWLRAPETSFRVSYETYQRRRWDKHRDVVMRHHEVLLPGG